MESQEVLESNMALCSTDERYNDLNYGGSLCDEGFKSEEVDTDVKGSECSNVDILGDLDTMMEEIDNRLRISRMVSDSVIKGIVNAVEQEADDKINAKELELASLKQSMQFLHVNGDQIESSWLQDTECEPETIDFDGYTSFEDVCVKYDKLKGSLLVLRNSASEQLKRLKEQIESVRGCKIRSSCGILKGNECESLVSIDRTVSNLEIMMNTLCRQVDGMIVFSKRTLRESLLEQEMKEELQAMVMQSSIRCLQEEFEENLWDHNVNWAKKLDEISGLRKELDALTRLFPSSDSGNLLSHGSFDADSFPLKALSSQLSSQWEENGVSNEAKTDVPENFDAAQLKHMKHEELVNFFNNRIAKIRRDHESTVQRMTENNISLKRKYLSERRYVLPQSKDWEILRKKIPEVISKLDKVFVEGDAYPESVNNGNNLDCLKDRLDSLSNDNRQLRNLLADKKEEVKFLSSQIFVASEKLLQHASSEANIQTLMKTFNLSMADTLIEASIMEDVYKCVIGELGDYVKCMKEESELEIVAIQDVYGVLLKEGTKTTNLCEIENSYMESLFMEELSKTIFKQTLKEAEEKFESLFNEHRVAIENLVSLEQKAVGMEAKIISEVEEKERLRKEVHLLGMMIEENENIARQLANEKEQFETLMLKTNKELDDISGKLMKAQEQIEIDKMKITSLDQKFELAMEEIKAANDLRNNNFALTKEKQSYMSLIEAKEKEHRKQMEAVVVLVDGLSTKLDDFECKVAGDILISNTRLENSSSQLSSLIKAANEIKRTGFIYKQKLERKCSDLQMAEDEVDLLGDEVETLLDLLEKIYIALDHYSPVLQHYPGVIEILKLVRRELSGEAVKAH